MIAVVLITTVESPPARILSATFLAEASSSDATRADTASGLRPMLAATASAAVDVSVEDTNFRLSSLFAATAASSAFASTALRVWAASGAAIAIDAIAAHRTSEWCLDTRTPVSKR